ncbi:hypothetical protein [Kibdelosporangium philippinense]|uniref:hypothetical protein n=1 Tax=Kibdelosporangium philippinense TaxID=211113 RepID=UPI00360A40A8
MLHVATSLPVAPRRLVLCLCDLEADHHFTTARSRAAHAVRTFAIEVVVVELSAELEVGVRTA